MLLFLMIEKECIINEGKRECGILSGMRKPISVHPLAGAEQQTPTAGLRLSYAFVLYRGQILLSSTRGECAPQVIQQLDCDDRTVLNARHAFNEHGLDALQKGSLRP
jgi:hypothetical protein